MNSPALVVPPRYVAYRLVTVLPLPSTLTERLVLLLDDTVTLGVPVISLKE